MKKNILISFTIFIIFLVLIFNIPQKHNIQDIKGVEIAGQSLQVDLALTPEAQEQGLSGRPSLNTNQGMLFVFPTPGKYPFWMPDMNFSIDIIWISENLKVVYIQKNATPESYPATFGPGASDQDAKYVLEVVSGFSDKNNLKVGDDIKFTY